MNMRNTFYCFVLLISISCQSTTSSLDEEYLQDLGNWKAERVTDLKQPFGYLSMVGLHWLKDGVNTMGSAPDNDIVLPSDLPAHIGRLEKKGDEVMAKMDLAEIKINGEISKTSLLQSDATPAYPKMNWGSYYWYLIKRGDRYGIRVKDTLADMRLQTESLPYFDPNPEMIIQARYIPPTANESTSIKNHIGITYQSEVKGRLRFTYGGKDYEFVGTNGGDDTIFVVFGDDTNGEQTYGGGRFLYVDIPEDGQAAILDFNKAENPICALNDFGTCPYPPAQNILDFPITAGEQKVR